MRLLRIIHDVVGRIKQTTLMPELPSQVVDAFHLQRACELQIGLRSYGKVLRLWSYLRVLEWENVGQQAETRHFDRKAS